MSSSSDYSLKKKPPVLLGVVLAGGDGVRLAQGPKAMVTLAGQPLLSHVITRLAPQLSQLAIGVRARAAWSDSLRHEVITDDALHAGPLAGVAAALMWARKKDPAVPAVLTCPTDSPFIPHDLAAHLDEKLTDNIDIVVASSNGRAHHLTALWRTNLTARLVDHLRTGGAMAVHRFQDQCRVQLVDWPTTLFDPFFNINIPDDLRRAESHWSSDTEKERGLL